jgi:hypothetical protein
MTQYSQLNDPVQPIKWLSAVNEMIQYSQWNDSVQPIKWLNAVNEIIQYSQLNDSVQPIKWPNTTNFSSRSQSWNGTYVFKFNFTYTKPELRADTSVSLYV